jgi:hypothetical protein
MSINIDIANSVIVSGQNNYNMQYDTLFFRNVCPNPPSKISIKCALEYAEKMGHQVIASIQISKGNRKFGSFPTTIEFMKAALTAKHMYEILPENLPRHFFADLEWDPEDPAICEDLFNKFIDFVFEFTKTSLGVTEFSKEMQISTATGNSSWQDGIKASYHVVFGFGFVNQEECKWFANALHKAASEVPEFMYFNKKIKRMDCMFDKNPYSRNQAWRCCYNSKADEPNRPLIPCMGSSENIQDHFVGVYNHESDAKITYLDATPLATTVYKTKLTKAKARCDSIKLSENNTDTNDGVALDRIPSDLLEETVSFLDPKRACEYNEWLLGMSSIYNESYWGGYHDEGYRMAHALSAMDPAYTKEYTDEKWYSLHPMADGPGGMFLYSWLAKDNPEAYKRLRRRINLAQGGWDNRLREYYRPNFDNYDFPIESYCDRYTRPFDLINNDIAVVVCAPKSGKTFQAKQLILDNPDRFKRILVMSPRQAFSKFVTSEFNRSLEKAGVAVDHWFVDYKDASNASLKGYNRVAVQMESLHRIEDGYYDLVIWDECESCLKQLSSDKTMKKLNKVVAVIEHIMNTTDKLLFMDAFLSDRSLNFVKNFRANRSIQCYINKWRHSGRKATPIFYRDMRISKKILVENIFKRIRAGENIVLFTSSKGFGDYVMDLFEKNFGDTKKAMFYCKDTDDKIMKEHLDDVNKAWIQFNLLIFSPKIIQGVSFDMIHFDKMFVYAYSGSCCVRDVNQAMVRVRNFRDDDIIFLINTFGPRPPAYLLTYEGTKEREMENADLITKYYNDNNMSLKRMQNKIVGTSMDIARPKEDRMAEVSGHIDRLDEIVLRSKPLPNWLFDCHVRNRLEDNISAARFMGLYYDYLRDSGFELTEDISTFDREAPRFIGVNDDEERDPQEEEEIEADQEVTGYESIPVIDAVYAQYIQRLVFSGNAEKLEKKCLERYEFDHKFHGDPEKMAFVFDLINKDNGKGHILRNRYDELRMNTQVEIDSIVQENDKIMMMDKQASVVNGIRKLCGLLGFRSTLDTETIIEEEKFNTDDVRNVVEELIKLMNLNSQSKKNDGRAVRAKVKMILSNFTGGTLKWKQKKGEWNAELKKMINRDCVYMIGIEDNDIIMMNEIV